MTTIGAIRWDPFTGNNSLDRANSLGAHSRTYLSPAAWRGRVPFYMTEASPTLITGRSDTQDVCDEEIRKAYGMGVDYFIYCFEGGGEGTFPAYPNNGQPFSWADVNASLRLHQTSSVAHLTKICANLICVVGLGVPVKDDPSTWSTIQNYLVTLFQHPAYMTVLGGRPLMYLYEPDDFVASPYGGSSVAAKAALDALRAACVTATGKNPYIVGNNALTAGFTNFASLGLDATGYYSIFPNGAGLSYATYKGQVEAAWPGFGPTPVVPSCSLGVDFRPISDAPIAGSAVVFYGEGTPGPWNVAPTYSEFAAHITACKAWIAANPALCPADTMSIYAWSEFIEGAHGLCPTIGDQGRYGQTMAQALGKQRDSQMALRARGYPITTRF